MEITPVVYRDSKGRFSSREKAVSREERRTVRDSHGRFARIPDFEERPRNLAFRILFRIRGSRRYEYHDFVYPPNYDEERVKQELEVHYESGGNFPVKVVFISETESPAGTHIFLADLQAGGNYQ